MGRVSLYLLNAVLLLLLAVPALLFFALSPLWFLAARLFTRWGRGDAGRIFNYFFGRAEVNFARPLVRVRRRGLENVPDGPFVAVANHRSFADIFFCTLIPRPNIQVVVRSWPFRLPILGLYMRLAGYYDVESRDLEDIVRDARELARQRVTFLFFPEGHRSRNGALRPFRSGAFAVAEATGLPILPVCLTGTERLGGRGSFLARTSTVTITFLPPIRMEDYPVGKRQLRARREAQERIAAALVELEGC
ncbi:1-acyl-sn-glycerol-3-phosphate acyltransferase [bacterium]|nr:1-acyl-sn-glycerol-3-phosphate acyltransferase [bacterium]